MRNKARMPEELKRRVQELRREATEAEVVLWRLLRGRRFKGIKFRRQHTVLGYVLDFYCEEAKLGIELDGDVHREAEQAQYDDERSRMLAGQQGIKVMRFWNSRVLNQTKDVMQEIEREVNTRLSPVGRD